MMCILTSVTGGFEPLVANWETGYAGFNPTDLAPGIYKVNVQDACGQVITEYYEVAEPEILEVTTLSIAETFAGQNDGSIETSISGGTGPYHYEWNNDGNTSSIENLSVGQYCVTVTDAFGCTASTCDLVLGGPTSTNEINGLTKLEIAPNPASEITIVQIEFSEQKEISIEMYSSVGELLYEMKNDKIQSKTYSLNVSNYPSGMYFVKVSSEGQQVVKRLVVK